MAWHVTPIENVQKILSEGLLPAIGPRSEKVDEEVPMVHLFSTFDDLQDAAWLWEDEFDEDAQLALFHVAVPSHEGAWTELSEAVPAEKLRLLSLDAGSIEGTAQFRAFEALDQVVDPLADLEAFQKTRVEMKARDLGALIGDRQWENDAKTDFLVYAAGYWIERLENGMHMLTIGNRGMITAEGTTLEELEAALFDYAVEESRPACEEPVVAPEF